MPKPISISAVIITFNEEKYIEQCIKSLKSVVDEVVIVDSYSTDKTQEICQNLNVTFLQKDWLGYAETKNWGNSQAKNHIILSIDADEELSQELKKSILNLKQDGFVNVSYSFNRLNNYCGKWMKHGGWYPDKKIRIFNREDAHWEGDVHEKLIFNPNINNKHIAGDLLHYSIESKEDHISREKKYASLAEPYKNSVLALFSSVSKFVKMYFMKLGFLDGVLGFQLALISAKAKFWR